MSAPQYFLPRILLAQLAPGRALARSLLAARGLGEVYQDVRGLDDLAYSEIATTGADGGHGIVLSALPVAGEPPRRIGYHPKDEAIRWTQLSEDLWAAIDTHAAPTPADLLRRDTIRGHLVRLADGNQWEFPVVRHPTGATELPRDMYWDDAGRFRCELKPEYRRLWDRTARVVRLFFERDSEDFGKIDLAEALDIAVEALALNYRFGRAEQRLLRLVDSTNWQHALYAIIDGPTVDVAAEEYETAKKKQPASADPPPSPNGLPGAAADCAITDLVAENCI